MMTDPTPSGIITGDFPESDEDDLTNLFDRYKDSNCMENKGKQDLVNPSSNEIVGDFPESDVDDDLSSVVEISGDKDASDDFCSQSLNTITGEFPEDDDDYEDQLYNITLEAEGKHLYRFGEIVVEFPYEAYDSQIQMMEKAIAGVTNGQNCLLESPTGTGKTAALLCALLAWQKKHNVGSSDPPTEPSACECGFDIYPDAVVAYIQDRPGGEYRLQREAVYVEVTSETTDSRCVSLSKKKLVVQSDRIERTDDQLCPACSQKYFPSEDAYVDEDEDEGNEFDHRPVIYYATRTHSQIKQVVEQLQKTAYANVRMTLLSGRKHSCINTEVRLGNAVDEDCRALGRNFTRMRQAKEENGTELQLQTCMYSQDKEVTQSEFDRFQKERNHAWDIEDAAEFGKSCGSCPYYGAKALHKEADIVFCSYNYLLYPSIRIATNVNLKNSILVFDEAHNIEEICREVCSITIDDGKLSGEVLHEVLNLMKKIDGNELEQDIVPSKLPQILQKLYTLLTALSNWICRRAAQIDLNGKAEVSVNIEPEVIFQEFKVLGLGPETALDLRANASMLGEKETFPRLEKNARDFIGKLGYVLSVIYKDELTNIKEFSYVVIRAKPNPKSGALEKYVFRLICLNPALAFRKLRNETRSIIVTSGTLSPTDSFESELKTPFQQQLSASHIVGQSQVWAGILTKPMSGNLKDIALTRAKQSSVEMQDWLGQTILQYCRIVPYGVLVFLPSYTFRDALYERWAHYPKNNPLMQNLRRVKEVFTEKSCSQLAFKKMIDEYRTTILTSDHGCVLFAIFRGKVSEGMDFKNEQARAVITVGIPNLPIVDPGIVCKMEYNRQKSLLPESTLLSGDDWYDCQAYRAINQAFGRCVRDSNDWGALILLDTRLAKKKHKLSKWVQDFLQVYDNPRTLNSELIKFFRSRTEHKDLKN